MKVYADNEFGSLKPLVSDMLRGLTLNIASGNEYVPDIKRRIRVVKERARSMRLSAPYIQVPTLITIHLVINVGSILTNFCAKDSLNPL